MDERHLDVIAPMTSTARRPVARSRTLGPDDIVIIDGIPTTTVGRTLLDLGARTTMADLEIALESALRGPDPKRPDVWHQDLLSALEQRASDAPQRAGTGLGMLRALLRHRRPDARPTGSRAETIALQELRSAGFHAYTQARIRIVTERNMLTYWADLADLDRALVIEIDGLEHHASAQAQAQDRDHRRQNIVTEALTLLRAGATAFMADPDPMVTTVMRRRSRMQPTADNWTQGAFQVKSTGDGWAMTYTPA
jgi:very-short-patch-repair endonuclease